MRTPVSDFHGTYALGFFQDIRVRRVAERLRCALALRVNPLKYLVGQYIVLGVR